MSDGHNTWALLYSIVFNLDVEEGGGGKKDMEEGGIKK